MKQPTKKDLATRLDRMTDENFALLFVAKNQLVEADHIICVMRHERYSHVTQRTACDNTTDVAYFGRDRADGGVVWLREKALDGTWVHLSAMSYLRFTALCRDEAMLGHHEYMTALSRLHAAQQAALDAKKGNAA